jgi:hypothetical protein
MLVALINLAEAEELTQKQPNERTPAVALAEA